MPRVITGTLCTSENEPKKLIGRLSISGPQGERGPAGPAGGVVTWNNRQGEVLPEIGDYSLSMVGGTVITNTEIDDLWEDYK